MTAGRTRPNTNVMMIHASPDRPAWRQWTVQLPAVLATLTCFFLGSIGWFFAEALTGYNCAMNDGPPLPGCAGAADWGLAAAGLGQWVLAAAAITLGIRSRNRPGSRPSGAIACWLVIPLAAGWFTLGLMISQR